MEIIIITIWLICISFTLFAEPLTNWNTRRKEERKPKTKEERKPKTKEQERDTIKDLYDKKLLQIQRQDIETWNYTLKKEILESYKDKDIKRQMSPTHSHMDWYNFNPIKYTLIFNSLLPNKIIETSEEYKPLNSKILEEVVNIELEKEQKEEERLSNIEKTKLYKAEILDYTDKLRVLNKVTPLDKDLKETFKKSIEILELSEEILKKSKLLNKLKKWLN